MGFALFLYVACSGCGDVFRPVIIPNPPQFPNPAASHTVVSINDNGTVAPGTAMSIDVSGDTDESIANVGLAPVHAVQQSARVVLVVNHSVTGAQADSITKLTFNGTSIITSPAPPTISLPANSGPNFVATTEANQAYVLLPNLTEVGVINTNTNSLGPTFPVGNNPVAMAETPNAEKLYVANHDDNTISGFTINGTNLTSRTITGSGSFSAPLWVIARSDSQRVYVLNGTTGSPQDGVISTIDVTSTAGPDSVIDASVSAPGATYMLYDGNLNRLYIPGGSQLTILDVSQSIPAVLATIPVPSFTLLNSNPSTVPAIATAVAALPDGSRAYVSSYAVLPSQVSISSISGDGTTATYAYTLTAGHDLNPGVTITVAGTQQNGFDGTFIVGAIVSGTAACPGTCFQVPNTTTLASTPVSASGTGSNVFPQVTVVWTNSNTIKTTTGMPGFPDATNPTYANGQYYVPVCAATRFRFMMAAGGDSNRAYFASCDGGVVDIIYTSTDTYTLNLAEPVGTRPPIPPNPQNPPQNPIFLMAGP